jgi:hypothetical protein
MNHLVNPHAKDFFIGYEGAELFMWPLQLSRLRLTGSKTPRAGFVAPAMRYPLPALRGDTEGLVDLAVLQTQRLLVLFALPYSSDDLERCLALSICPMPLSPNSVVAATRVSKLEFFLGAGQSHRDQCLTELSSRRHLLVLNSGDALSFLEIALSFSKDSSDESVGVASVRETVLELPFPQHTQVVGPGPWWSDGQLEVSEDGPGHLAARVQSQHCLDMEHFIRDVLSAQVYSPCVARGRRFRPKGWPPVGAQDRPRDGLHRAHGGAPVLPARCAPWLPLRAGAGERSGRAWRRKG